MTNENKQFILDQLQQLYDNYEIMLINNNAHIEDNAELTKIVQADPYRKLLFSYVNNARRDFYRD